MKLQEILHVLAEGISLVGPVRDDLHTAIDALDKTVNDPTPANEVALVSTVDDEIAALLARVEQLRAGGA